MMQQTSAPTWVGVGALLVVAIGLAFVGLLVVVTVVIASGRSSAINRQLKSAGLVLLVVVPALAVVGLVGGWVVAVRPVTQTATVVYETTQAQRAEPPRPPIPPEPVELARIETNVVPVVVQRAEIESGTPRQVAELHGQIAEADGKPTVNEQVATVALTPRELSEYAAGVLHVRETLPNEPEWAKISPLPSDPGVLVPLSSQRFATLGEAEVQVTQLAVRYVKQFYGEEYPLPGDWTVPVSLIDTYGVKTLVGEELDKDFGNGLKGKMYRAHLRLDLNPKLRQALHASWNEQIVRQRLTMLGTGLGMITVVLAASAGYFRLNEMTHGQYGGRLKLAATAIIGAAGLGVLALG